MSTTYKGEEQILYFNIEGSFIPIGCLTSNSFSESVEMLDTTTQDNEGWKTSVPTNQSYNISFEGIQTLTPDTGAEKYSYDYLKILKRNRTLIDWRSQVDGIWQDEGQAYITEISENAATGELMTFSVSMEGYGKPNKITVDYNVLTFVSGDTIQTLDNDIIVTT